MSDIAALMIIDEICYEGEEQKSKNCQKMKKRKTWSKQWYLKRELHSNKKLLKELKETEPLDYKNYMRMDDKTFLQLLRKVKSMIQKQDTFMRDAIPAEVRLSITLRAIGNSSADMKFATAVSPQAISEIVIETCQAVIVALKDCIKCPTNAKEWQSIADRFYEKSGFPHCLGALDGKHIHIKKPHHSGSYFFNYKKLFSIVLMAIVDNCSNFLMVDFGANGRISDGGVFSNTKFFKKLESNALHLPEPKSIAPNGELIPFVFVSDDAFALRNNIMKPFAHSNLTSSDIMFNKRLSSARVRVENAYGILASRFRVLYTFINLCPEKATTIVLACCYLHNFLTRTIGIMNSSLQLDEQEESAQLLMPLEATFSRNSSLEAKTVRKNICEAIQALE